MLKIKDEWDTMREIISRGRSISRYGDGEIKLCYGHDSKSQKHDKILSSRLRYVAKNPTERCLVGIPRIWGRVEGELKWEYWKKYATNKTTSLFDVEKQYHSAFITRPDSSPSIYCNDYWTLLSELFNKRDICFVEGEGAKSFKNIQELYSNSSSVKYLKTPTENAFEVYQEIYDACLKEVSRGKNLFVLALGATATVLAYDLSNIDGVQALDLGHLPMFYSRWKKSLVPKDW